MVNWDDIGKLHVIAKLGHIINKWYGIEMLWADSQHNICSGHTGKEYNFKNHLLKMQMLSSVGSHIISSDIERIEGKKTVLFDSGVPHVKGVASRLMIDGEMAGTFLAYPIISEDITESEKKEIIDFLKEHNVNEKDAKSALNHMPVCSQRDIDYLHELIELAREEATEFSEEINSREEIIKDLNSELGEKYRYHTMIGKSKKMQQIYHLLDKISNSESSVFIQGENGTGKELVAKAVHYFSPRRDKMFLAVNCSALNDNLLDSELFGHVKGSFTGAVRDKKGLFEQANGGTLFLDEIGDTSLPMQVKLLRVLQEGTYLPVGSTTPRRCNVRIIAATNKPVQEMIESGRFREDLYYRINVINVALPPLRERMEDIPILIDYFLKKRCDEVGLSLKSFSKRAMEKLLDHAWPGNVRELQNEVERAVVLADQDKVIDLEMLSSRVTDAQIPRQGGAVAGVGLNTAGNLKKAVEELEAFMIQEGLVRCSYNKSKLARELGISRASLISKVAKYALEQRRKAA